MACKLPEFRALLVEHGEVVLPNSVTDRECGNPHPVFHPICSFCWKLLKDIQGVQGVYDRWLQDAYGDKSVLRKEWEEWHGGPYLTRQERLQALADMAAATARGSAGASPPDEAPRVAAPVHRISLSDTSDGLPSPDPGGRSVRRCPSPPSRDWRSRGADHGHARGRSASPLPRRRRRARSSNSSERRERRRRRQRQGEEMPPPPPPPPSRGVPRGDPAQGVRLRSRWSVEPSRQEASASEAALLATTSKAAGARPSAWVRAGNEAVGQPMLHGISLPVESLHVLQMEMRQSARSLATITEAAFTQGFGSGVQGMWREILEAADQAQDAGAHVVNPGLPPRRGRGPLPHGRR